MMKEMEEAHTPKRQALEQFVQAQSQHAPGWQVRVADHREEPVVVLHATSSGGSEGKQTTLEVHTRQVSLTGDQIDESTKKMILRWLDSLVHGERTATSR